MVARTLILAVSLVHLAHGVWHLQPDSGDHMEVLWTGKKCRRVRVSTTGMNDLGIPVTGEECQQNCLASPTCEYAIYRFEGCTAFSSCVGETEIEPEGVTYVKVHGDGSTAAATTTAA
eukprot:CAMPEP_0170632792 /NCGR_PEP_ID=MMETSP0224-20130122/35550_1 /TAXON_ID=285029 /ORGANISM="Togula jolla, Strain CCCM 725" /LENGTH=117 /DNA_ID=CAMNT_0010961595 /DNA_START=26 /DNA_END=375 /DNA_ORIENTATION=+